jgi:hypothetical protein
MLPWRIKLNETKSVHIDFTNKRIEHKPIYINHHVVPYENTAKYLGMTLDTKLRWKPHVKKKKEDLELKYRKMYWLMGHYSALSVYNKLSCTNRFSSQYGLMVFNFGVVPAKATEISYKDSRIE